MGSGGVLAYAGPSNRRWCHPSHSSLRLIAPFSQMALYIDQGFSTHHFKGFSTVLSVLIDDEGDGDGWGQQLEGDFAR